MQDFPEPQSNTYPNSCSLSQGSAFKAVISIRAIFTNLPYLTRNSLEDNTSLCIITLFFFKLKKVENVDEGSTKVENLFLHTLQHHP